MFDSIFNALSVIKPLLGDSRLLFSAAIGIAVTLVILTAVYLLMSASNPVRRRLQMSRKDAAVQDTFSSKVDRAVQPLKPIILPKSDKELSSIRKRLIYSGFRSNEAVTTYYALKILLMLLLGFIGALIGYFILEGTSKQIMYCIGGGVLLGILLPSYYLDKKVAARQEKIVNAFPDMLDLLVACSEAGLGFNAALQRVGRETKTMYPELGEEIELVNAEIRTGVDRVQALKSLSARTGVDEISGFVSMISQSIRFGTSISDTLRVFAEEFRDKRMSRAEEQAAKVATKLIFPLVLCIFPSFFVVAVGPSVLALIKVFGQMSVGN